MATWSKIPYKKIVLKSDLEPEFVVARIRGKLFSRLSILGNSGFCGVVDGSRFKIYYNRMWVRNSFRPIYFGEVKGAEAVGSEVIIEAKLSKFTLAFMSVWFGGLFLLFVAAIFDIIVKHRMPNVLVLIFPVFLMFGFALVKVSFYWGLSNSEKALADLVGAVSG